MMDDRTRDQLMFEANRKSTGATYLLWFFLGTFGAHRFYLGRISSGVGMLMLALLGWLPLFLGWVALGIWWLIDAFLIPDIIRAENMKAIDRIESRHAYRY